MFNAQTLPLYIRTNLRFLFSSLLFSFLPSSPLLASPRLRFASSRFALSHFRSFASASFREFPRVRYGAVLSGVLSPSSAALLRKFFFCQQQQHATRFAGYEAVSVATGALCAGARRGVGVGRACWLPWRSRAGWAVPQRGSPLLRIPPPVASTKDTAQCSATTTTTRKLTG